MARFYFANMLYHPTRGIYKQTNKSRIRGVVRWLDTFIRLYTAGCMDQYINSIFYFVFFCTYFSICFDYVYIGLLTYTLYINCMYAHYRCYIQYVCRFNQRQCLSLFLTSCFFCIVRTNCLGLMQFIPKMSYRI